MAAVLKRERASFQKWAKIKPVLACVALCFLAQSKTKERIMLVHLLVG